MSVCKSKEKMKITILFELIFFEDGAQVLSHQFSQRLARGLRPNNGVVHTGNTTGDHNREAQRGKQNGKQQRKVKKHVCIFMYLLFIKLP